MLNDYYSQLFSSSNPQDFDRILDGVDVVVSDEMRENLAQSYITEEVDATIKEMAPLKALGPNGMPPLFYQTYWIDVGMDVHQAVLSSLNSGAILKSINHTVWVLFGQHLGPNRNKDPRPFYLF